MERYIFMMIKTKYFQYRDRDFKKAESLIINPKKYFTVLSARLVSGDVYDSKIFKFMLTFKQRTTFLKIGNNCNAFSSYVRSLYQIFGTRKEIEYFVDFREVALRLKQFCENFVRCLSNGFLINSLNVNGALFLLSLYIKARYWWLTFKALSDLKRGREYASFPSLKTIFTACF